MTSSIQRWTPVLALLIGCSARDAAPQPSDASETELAPDAEAAESLDAALAPDEDARADDARGPEAGPAAMDAATNQASDAALAAPSAIGACFENLRAQCERRAECQIVPNFENCWQAYYRFCPDVFFAPGSQRTAEGLRSCAEAWRQMSCDALERGAIPACALPGTRQAGESCLFSSQCASNRCSSNGGDQCGVCRALLQQGERCSGSTDKVCAQGLSCGDAGTCVSEAPLRIVPLGAACGNGRDDCGSNRCAFHADGGAVCVVYPRLGESCAQTGLCAGEDGSYCDVSNVCLKAPGAGEPCARNAFDHDECDRASQCAGDPPRCRARPRAGESCVGGCSDGSSCGCVDAVCATSRCVFRRRLGERCDDAAFRLCDEPQNRCQDGLCVEVTGLKQDLFEKACGR